MPMFMPMFKGSEIDGYNNTRPTIRSTILYTRDCLSKVCFQFEPKKGYLLKTNNHSQAVYTNYYASSPIHSSSSPSDKWPTATTYDPISK